MLDVRRRAFITLLGGAAAAWPLAAAQQGERVRRIGVLTPFPADDAEGERETQRSVSGEIQDRLKRSLMNSGSHPEAVLGPGAVVRCSTTTRRSTSPFR